MRTKAERLHFRMPLAEYKSAARSVKTASAIQYFLPGLPTIYYGDEIGMQGYEDPINRRPYAYGYEDPDLLAHYRYLGKIHAEFPQEFSIGCGRNYISITRGKYTLHVYLENMSYTITNS